MILEIDDYSESEIKNACQQSSAINHYFKLLNQHKLPELYKLRHKAWLRSALATIYNKHSARQVCEFWSQQTLKILNDEWIKTCPDNQNISLYALGKLGAQELNLSSDIDLVFFSKTQPSVEEIKSLQLYIKTLSANSEFGLCYRVDINLRPGGRFGPIVTSIRQLEDYLWSQAANWERVAYVRLLPVFTDPDSAQQINELIRSFVYRKYLDYNLLEDIKDLRSQIHGLNQKKHLGDFNLKLDEGGIRDVELFINSMQVIHGGKNKDLQLQSTDAAYKKLVQDKLIKTENGSIDLLDHYWQLRSLENYAQCISDQQTHLLNGKYFSHLAIDFNQFKLNCQNVFEKVSSLLGDTPLDNLTESEVKLLKSQQLIELGFKASTVNDIWPELTETLLNTPHKNKNTKIIITFLNKLMLKLSETSYDKDLGVSLALTFVKNNRVKISIFTLLLREEKLFEDIVTLLASSPYLGGILSQRPELLDSFIYKKQEYSKSDFELLLEELTDTKIINEMSCSAKFLKDRDVIKYVTSLSENTDQIIKILFTEIKTQMQVNDLDILALGKWGGFEVGLRSDLDLVFVKTKGAITKDDHRAAKRLISRLIDQHKGGQLYKVDLRLKPSGVSGPLLLTFDQLTDYLAEKAEIWERMPYVKSRMIFDTSLSQQIHSACKKQLVRQDEAEEMERIKLQLIEKNQTGDINLKYNSGGLLAVEFLTQMHSLNHPQSLKITSTFELLDYFANYSGPSEKWLLLKQLYIELRQIEQLLALSTFSTSQRISQSKGNFLRISALLKMKPEELIIHIKHIQFQITQTVNSLTL